MERLSCHNNETSHLQLNLVKYHRGFTPMTPVLYTSKSRDQKVFRSSNLVIQSAVNLGVMEKKEKRITY